MSKQTEMVQKNEEPLIAAAKGKEDENLMQRVGNSIKTSFQETTTAIQESNSLAVNIIRRFFSSTGIFIGLANTINIVNRVGYMLSTKSPELQTLSIDGISPNKQCVDLGSSDGTQCCSYGIKQVVVNCSLRNRQNFQAAIVVSCLVWASVFCTQIFLNYKFDTNDLRYFVSLERSKSHWATKQ
jgi:hypothetical protein